MPAPKPTKQALNPKLTVIRKALAKARPLLLRGVGTLARVQVNPKAAETEVAALEAALLQAVQSTLAGGPVAVTTADQPLPAAGWVILPLSGRMNAKHGNPCCGPALGFVQEGRMAAVGVLLANAEDAILASAGEGAHGFDGRLRVAARELTDAMVQLPMSSPSGRDLELLTLAADVPFHTRKTGNQLADALNVAQGSADGLIATRLTPFEGLAIDLLVKEAGGTSRTLATKAGETLLAGNVKVVQELAAKLA